ncbi:MAG: SGNH/GDSL hydrolase family protein [Leptolyngbya sp. PLA3]|nr:MAG: SGNH/GDSL hydrolase family protein [Cyanobacteria bacterium CYA]MCE7968029.1 SGNH/GDSL hydrolase family protein [Leptolyngbya sp. PL-A3]
MRGISVIGFWVCAAGAVAQPVRPLAEGLHRQVLPLYRDLHEAEVGSLGIVGDSVSLLDASYNWQLRNHFWDDFGSGGDGYLALARFNGNCGSNGGGPRCGIESIRGPGSFVSEDTGAWEPLGYSTPDGMWGQLRFDRVPGNWTVKTYGREVVVHYTRRTGGGAFRLLLNGSPVATIDTGLPAGEPQAGAYLLDTGEDDPDTLSTIRFEMDSTLPVQINAVEMRSAGGGLRYHRLARGGCGPARYLESMTTANAELLRSLDLDLLIIMLDAAAGDGNNEPALYQANLETLVDWYRAELSGVPMVLVTHHPFTPEIEAQADVILDVARTRGLGYVNFYDLFSGFDEMDALGYMNGIVHLSPAGGAYFGGYLYDLLTTAADQALLADWNADGEFDFFDVQAFLDSFSGGGADLNGDGVSNFFDVQMFLAAFSAAHE